MNIENKIEKVWFKKGSALECYACNYPYEKENIIKNGLPYEVWVKTDTCSGELNAL